MQKHSHTYLGRDYDDDPKVHNLHSYSKPVL
jgi:hypothetical protein